MNIWAGSWSYIEPFHRNYTLQKLAVAGFASERDLAYCLWRELLKVTAQAYFNDLTRAILMDADVVLKILVVRIVENMMLV